MQLLSLGENSGNFGGGRSVSTLKATCLVMYLSFIGCHKALWYQQVLAVLLAEVHRLCIEPNVRATDLLCL